MSTIGMCCVNLRMACVFGHDACARLLLQASADVNKAAEYGDTPLHFACAGGHDACARLLVKAGADVNKAGNKGDTPLHSVCKNGHDAIASLLLDAGADPEKDDKWGRIPLHIAHNYGHYACARVILKNTDVDKADNCGRTQMHVACKFGRDALVSLLLESGADCNKVDKYGWTPLRRACMTGHDACKVLLIRAGARVTVSSFWRFGNTVETAVAVGASQFIRRVFFPDRPSEENCAIMWRSPSLEKIAFLGGEIRRPDEPFPNHVMHGDKVRLLDTDGVWQVAEVMGDEIRLEGSNKLLPARSIVLAGPAHLMWYEANAAEATGRSNVATRVLSRRGFISARVRYLVDSFL